MNGYVDWIVAEADGDDPAKEVLREMPAGGEERCLERPSPQSGAWANLPTQNFVVRGLEPEEPEPTCALDRNPDLWLYRRRTAALLRRYMKLSLETGRLPSVIGREFFRAKVTAYKGTTFEDRVIFVHDVESCLERLSRFDQGIIARLVLQEHDHERAARLLNCARKTLERRLPELLDELSEVFLSVGLLVALSEGGKK